MKKYLYTILAVALAQMPLQATAKVTEMTKGDYFFNHHGYNKALDHYQKLVDAAPRKKDPILAMRMADCYRLTNQPAMAVAYYSKALNDVKPGAKRPKNKLLASKNPANATLPNDIYLHYGQAEMSVECYEDAAMYLRQYLETTPGDRRAAHLIKGCEQAQALHSGMPEGVETFLPINTDLSDFSPTINNQHLVFSSDTTPYNFAAKKDKFTGDHFYTIYSVSCKKDGECGSDFKSLSAKGLGKFHDTNPVFTADGQTMYFTRTDIKENFLGESSVPDDNNKVHLQIMIASDYDDASKKYNKIASFPYNNKNYSLEHPALSADGNTLIFASDMPGGEGGFDLYYSKKDANGKWGEPVNLGKEINAEGDEVMPVFLDSKNITFTSNGQAGLGGMDVFYASWNDASQTWGDPVNAGVPVNSPYDDMSLTMYDDQQNGYFASNRPADKEEDNIFHYYRQKLILNLKIADSTTGRDVEGAVVSIMGVKDRYELTTDKQGNTTTPVYPITVYKVTVRKKGYYDLQAKLSTADIKRLREVDILNKTLKIAPEMDITFTAKILDEETRNPIENPLIVVTKEGSNYTDTINMLTGQPFTHGLEADAIYHINAIKDQYYSDEKVVSTKGMTGIIKLTDTMLMCRLGVGAICQIESIYYDFNKATIRTDAVPSLDKLIKLMHDFPHMQIQLNAHTDCRGSAPYNMRLSNARAESVVKYLIEKGVDPARLTPKGFGSTKPIYKCDNCKTCDESFRQQNRRTEFQVLKM